MRAKSALLLGLLFSGPAEGATFRKLVWSDSFSASGRPDPLKWKLVSGGTGWGNNELEFYTAANAWQETGQLVLEARNESYLGKSYTSARIVSRESWTYGRFEARLKLPAGRGSWPAFWMMPTQAPINGGAWPDNGEIDIMEHVGFDHGVVHGSLHMKAFNWMIGNQKTAVISIPTVDSEFHVYAVEWTPDEISFFVDDVRYLTYSNPHKSWEEWPFNTEFHLILNVAIGGSWGGQKGIDDSAFPQRMTVESVRVYQ